MINTFKEKLPQVQATRYNNADARNETFERYNGTFKQQCCDKYSKSD